MSSAPSMPMFWDAYLADTTHLTTEEHGAYLLLLGAMWRRNGSVPDVDRDNARILGLTAGKWRQVKARLAPLLIIENGQITQKNLQKIWKITQEKIAVNRMNGAKGGRPKTKENNDVEKPNGFDSVKRNETIPEPEPEPEVKETTANAVVVPAATKSENVDYVRADRAFQLFVQAATRQPCWSVPEAINKTRRASLMARIREVGLDGWERAINRAEQSPFLTGRTGDKPFSLAIDWMLKPANFTKIVEGNYDDRSSSNGSRSGHSGSNGGRTGAFDRLADRLQGGSGWPEAEGHDDPGAEGGHIIDIGPARITG